MADPEVDGLTIRPLASSDSSALTAFFDEIVASHADRWFQPHAFDTETAHALCGRVGRDQYYAMWNSGHVIGYGMLRGWDEDYAIPSLGIVIHPARQRMGLGVAMMHFLHGAARLEGATRIRLTVEVANDRAVTLYRRLGYDLRRLPDRDTFEGHLEL